jgi:MIP family channel proteins
MKDLKAYIAEFVGTFALVLIGVGAVCNGNRQYFDWLGIALAHGLVYAAMVSATAALSGGHLNPAVTLGACIGGKLAPRHAAGYLVAQLVGAVLAGLVCVTVLGKDAVSTATPDLGRDVTMGTGIAVESLLTFFLVFVMFGTTLDPRGPKVGGLAVGLVVAACMLFGGPITGAALNPARALGPAVASMHLTGQLVYWIGPLLGGAAAGLLYGRLLILPDPSGPPLRK